MVKRKANQADLEIDSSNIRRSKRITATISKNDKIIELNGKLDNKITKTNTRQKSNEKTLTTATKIITKSTVTKPTQKSTPKPITKPTRTTKQQTRSVRNSIINEKIDLNKDPTPIKTYGKIINKINEQKSNDKSPSKIIKKKPEQLKKSGSITLKTNSLITSNFKQTNVQQPQQKSTINVIDQGGEKKIVINKIIMPPDAYNQFIKQQQLNSNQKTMPNQLPFNQTEAVIKNLQANLGPTVKPIVFSSGVKVLNAPSITVTNPSTSVLTSNVLPINQSTNNQQSNIRFFSNVIQFDKNHQIQVPIILKSFAPTLPITVATTTATSSNQQQQSLINTQTKTTSSIKVNPITSVKSVFINNKTPEKKSSPITQVSPTTRPARKTRVSFNFERNTSTSIKPISNDLPLTASTVLMTSTPKQSIIKKPKTFDLPCTPIVNNLNSRRGARLVAAATASSSNRAVVENTKANSQTTISQEIKSKLEKISTASNSTNTSLLNNNNQKVTFKYCKNSETCDCLKNISKSEIEEIKNVYKNLNLSRKMMYIYCSTIKLNDEINLDFQKYAFFIKTSIGFKQICHRAFMDLYDKQNLSFVDTSFKKILNV